MDSTGICQNPMESNDLCPNPKKSEGVLVQSAVSDGLGGGSGEPALPWAGHLQVSWIGGYTRAAARRRMCFCFGVDFRDQVPVFDYGGCFSCGWPGAWYSRGYSRSVTHLRQ